MRILSYDVLSPLVLPRGLGRRDGRHGWHGWHGWHGHGRRGYGQMIAGGLEAVLAGRVVDGAPLAVGVHVAVRAASVAFRVRLLLELDTVSLLVRGAELTVVGQVPGVRQDGGVLLRGDQRHRPRQRHQDKYLQRMKSDCFFFSSVSDFLPPR